MDADELGSEIVAIQRRARFAEISTDEWSSRLHNLISAQPEVMGDVAVENVRQVGTAAGGSNGTLLFEARYRTAHGLQEKALVLRFLPVKGLFHRYDVRGQFELQRALSKTDVRVPLQVWLDEYGKWLERPGYIMEQVAGVSPPMTWMTSGVLAEAPPAMRRQMVLEYIHALARIHAVDWRALGLQWLEGRAAGTRPVQREVNWYRDALKWSGHERYVEELEPVARLLIDMEPADVDTVLCHGDANLGNYMFDGGRITAVVDWEMAFLGTPECDLSYLEIGDSILQGKTLRPEGVLTHAEMQAEYERVSGRKLRHMPYFLLFTSYRIAVINVLAMKHFPPDVLAAFMPVLESGPSLCLARAAVFRASAENGRPSQS